MNSIAALQARWNTLAPREQSLVLASSILVALALLWWVGIAPALRTMDTAAARHTALDAQLQRMQGMQAEAQQLQAIPRSGQGDPVGTLRAALTERLGNTAQLNVVGDRATVTLKAAPADALALWLAQARTNAHAAPVEVRLTRSATPAPAAVPNPAPAGRAAPASPNGTVAANMPRWDGNLVLALPAR